MPIYQRDNRYDRSEIINSGIRATVWPTHGIAIGTDAKINFTSEHAILIDPTHGPTVTKIRNSPDSIALGDVTRIINSREAIVIGKDIGVNGEDRVVKIGNDSNRLELSNSGILSLVGTKASFKLPSYATGNLPSGVAEGTIVYNSTVKRPTVWNGTTWINL